MNDRRALILSACALASSMLLGGCSRIPDTVKIGVAQPMTGPLAALGADMKNGVQLAVDELNAKGFKIDGKPVKLEIVAVDDKSNAERGKEVAKILVDAKVVAVVGHLNSGVSIAAAPVYAEAGIAQMAISTKPEYTPPVIYSNEQRAKLVFLVEAKPAPADAAKLRPGQPLSVTTSK